MRLSFILPLLGLCAFVSSVQFINPPPGGTAGDFSLNVVYTIGSTIDIQWVLGPLDTSQLSLVVYQATAGVGFDYILPNVNAGTTSYSWIVQTDKDLSVTHAFFFEIFMVGSTAPAAASHYFNITAADVISIGASSITSTTSATSTGFTSSTSLTSSIGLKSSTASTSSTSSTSASSLIGSSTSIRTSTTASTTEASISTTAVPSSNSSGSSTGAKVGLGVGVPIAVILSLAAGWFFFGRRRIQDASASATQSGGYEADKGPQATPPFYASQGPSPIEVEDTPGFAEAPGSPSFARYELHAPR